MKKKLLILLIIFLISYIYCTREAGDVVARVGTENISLKEFEQDFAGESFLNQLKSSSLKTREAHLENMIETKLAILAAYEQEIDKIEEIKKRIDSEKRRQLYLAAIQADIYDKLIPEAEVKEYYQYLNEKWCVSRIFLRFDLINNSQEKEKVKQKAWKLFNKIRDGEDFAGIAKKYSQDTKTALKGGDFGYVRWGKNKLGKNLMQVIFKLQPGEVSEPIKTQIGYHIFKLTEIKAKYKLDYEQESYQIQRILTDQNKREEFLTYFKSYYDSLKQKYAIKYEEENIRYFAEKLAASKEKKSMDKAGFNRFYLITEEKWKLPLITFGSDSITLGEHIATIIKKYPPYNYPAQYYVDETKKRLDGLLRIKLLAYHASQKGLQNSPVFQKKIKRLKEYLMVKTFEAKNIITEVYKTSNGNNERKKQAHQLWEELMLKLKHKYEVKINKKVLKNAYS